MTAAGSKILAGAREALAIAKGEAQPARVLQRGEDGTMHDITEQWLKTRERHEGASAGTDMNHEESHPAASPREAEAG